MEIRWNNINEICTDLIPLEAWSYKNKTMRKMEEFAKRSIDIIVGIFGILLLIPLTFIIWIAKLITRDYGSIFYLQKRIGKNGKLFKMYKYRSMVTNAEEKLENYLKENEEAREEYKKYKKLNNDPRITKIGKFLRKTSLDEFPQLINVLKGDMTLVGPRPYLPIEKEDMKNYYHYIVKCKPGITGFWQTNGRNKVTFNHRLEMDLEYYKHHCLELDFKLLKKTVKKVVKREGVI